MSTCLCLAGVFTEKSVFIPISIHSKPEKLAGNRNVRVIAATVAVSVKTKLDKNRMVGVWCFIFVFFYDDL